MAFRNKNRFNLPRPRALDKKVTFGHRGFVNTSSSIALLDEARDTHWNRPANLTEVLAPAERTP
jgi:hypothetical protein